MLDTTLISENPQAATASAFVLGGFFTVTMIISIVLCVMLIVAGWKIFKKAGEPGWKILIPFYNIYIFLKILNLKNWFWFMLALEVFLCIAIVVSNFDMNIIMYGEQTQAEAYLYSFDFASNPILIVAFFLNLIYSIILNILSAYRLSKVFGHGIGYTIGNIFLPEIFWLILGFGKSKYSKKNLKA